MTWSASRMNRTVLCTSIYKIDVVAICILRYCVSEFHRSRLLLYDHYLIIKTYNDIDIPSTQKHQADLNKLLIRKSVDRVKSHRPLQSYDIIVSVPIFSRTLSSINYTGGFHEYLKLKQPTILKPYLNHFSLRTNVLSAFGLSKIFCTIIQVKYLGDGMT